MINRSDTNACFKNRSNERVYLKKRPTAILIHCTWSFFEAFSFTRLIFEHCLSHDRFFIGGMQTTRPLRRLLVNDEMKVMVSAKCIFNKVKSIFQDVMMQVRFGLTLSRLFILISPRFIRVGDEGSITIQERHSENTSFQTKTSTWKKNKTR